MSNYQLANLILGETVHLSISVLMFFASVSACIHFIDGVFKQTQPKTPPESFVGVETSPTIVEPVPAPLEPVPDFTLANLYTIRELKAMASKRKVKNYGRLTKIQLVEALTSKD
jgi:hypothetical protein